MCQQNFWIINLHKSRKKGAKDEFVSLTSSSELSVSPELLSEGFLFHSHFLFSISIAQWISFKLMQLCPAHKSIHSFRKIALCNYKIIWFFSSNSSPNSHKNPGKQKQKTWTNCIYAGVEVRELKKLITF